MIGSRLSVVVYWCSVRSRLQAARERMGHPYRGGCSSRVQATNAFRHHLFGTERVTVSFA